MSDPNNEKNYTQFTKKVTIGCYIALAVAILFFSGLLNNVEGFKWLSALDFATISGKFGTMAHPAKNTFIGEGGVRFPLCLGLSSNSYVSFRCA